MKLIINISKEEYERFKKNQKKEYSESMIDVNIIANGTPVSDDNATNGEVFGKIMDCMFMDDARITTDKHGYLHLRGVKDDWLNAPYQNRNNNEQSSHSEGNLVDGVPSEKSERYNNF